MEGRYRRVVDLVELSDLLQARETGISIDEIADRFDVSRRTAERMLRALRDRYPDLAAQVRHGRKYWHLERRSPMAALGPAPDDWTSAHRIAEGMAQRVGESLDALIAAAEEGASDELLPLALSVRRTLDRSIELFRVEEPKAEPIDVDAVVAAVTEAARPRARAARVELRPIATGSQPWIEADRAQLARALLALVENAIDASPAGGCVRIEAQTGVEAGTRRFRVDDQGPGVSPAFRERIFEPYFSTREAAAGLGLSLAQAIARRSGGRVSLLSTPGAGASFLLEISTCHGGTPAGPAATGSAGA